MLERRDGYRKGVSVEGRLGHLGGIAVRLSLVDEGWLYFHKLSVYQRRSLNMVTVVHLHLLMSQMCA